jgi:hypothetical protein
VTLFSVAIAASAPAEVAASTPRDPSVDCTVRLATKAAHNTIESTVLAETISDRCVKLSAIGDCKRYSDKQTDAPYPSIRSICEKDSPRLRQEARDMLARLASDIIAKQRLISPASKPFAPKRSIGNHP